MMKTICIAILCFVSVAVTAQKNIIISKDLASQAEPLKVKLGTQWFGKTFNIRFGGFAIVSSKMGWGKQNSRTNFWGNKIKKNSTETFSFVLSNEARDSAMVNAVKNLSSKELSEIELLPNLTIGFDYSEEKTKHFTATIQALSDTDNIWTLLILQSQKGSDESRIAQLTSGNRKIELRPVTSATAGEKQNLPAKGYEFFENGQPLAALQYQGSGMLGLNKNFAWLSNELDSQTKLIIAAAMAAIFQVKGANPEG